MSTVTVPTLRSYVAGHWRDGDPHPDLNPSRPSESVATVQHADRATAAAAVRAALEAAHAWRRTPAPQRGEILWRASQLLDARAADIASDLAAEEGKTVVEAMGETRRAAAVFRYYAGQALEPDGETYPSHFRDTFIYARREPVGTVLAITPWNFPIAIPAWKIAPALVYGNAVVWKPAEYVPLTSVHMLEALIEAGLAAGVLNLVLGKGSVVGDALLDRGITALSFTGSNAVGRALQQKAVSMGIKVQLEMGGKNPAVVLGDADLELATDRVAKGAFLSAGQKCTATSRVVVESAIADEFGERLAARAAGLRVGDALDPQTVVGPVVSEEQMRTVLGYLEQGQRDGGRTLAGGDRFENGGGYFVKPTVLSGLPAGSRLLSEEIFGPVAALQVVSSFDEAVRVANDTSFGLSASVFTRDLGRALRFAEESGAGIVKVNQESAGVEPQVPFGGNGESSSGSREQGKAAREFFTAWKTVYVDIPPETSPA